MNQVGCHRFSSLLNAAICCSRARRGELIDMEPDRDMPVIYTNEAWELMGSSRLLICKL